ncbi:hypothetical protein [Micromonospora aurantiaca (nom. illeg.)]|uniref:hypothetical protein n=1 Tax=Micromonospora aurantiaca (nom. illeg.) TaxID=47850 RepID=UPI0011A4D8CB|nr:hypothetical protein [Micromonospora aurantiaca]MBC9003680.1 hypothetical protein [Micromonospora aurantiaca]
MPLSQATPLLLREPGFLFSALLASAEPLHAAAGSSYDADPWPVAWIPWGPTLEGSVFGHATNVEPVRVAELFEAVAYSVTEVTTTLAFAVTNFTLHNMARAMNAPSSAVTTVSGTGATLSSKLEPPDPETIVRRMIGWESLDHTLRLVGRQCLNGGEIQSNFARGATPAGIATVWNFERPASGKAFAFYGAGTGRLGA